MEILYFWRGNEDSIFSLIFLKFIVRKNINIYIYNFLISLNFQLLSIFLVEDYQVH